jgi:hypothetical protein
MPAFAPRFTITHCEHLNCRDAFKLMPGYPGSDNAGMAIAAAEEAATSC